MTDMAIRNMFAQEFRKEPVVTSYGFQCGPHAVDINMSTVWTYLVKEVGGVVERYSSDLLISYEEVRRRLQRGEVRNGDVFYFGIRDDGVDNMPYVAAACEKGGTPKEAMEAYIELYALQFCFDDGNVKARLFLLYRNNERRQEQLDKWIVKQKGGKIR